VTVSTIALSLENASVGQVSRWVQTNADRDRPPVRDRSRSASVPNPIAVSELASFYQAFRAKRAKITAWLGDVGPKVRAFAAKFMARMDQRIASEQRSAEERTELRKREYDID
jgi:hypothetical protein